MKDLKKNVLSNTELINNMYTDALQPGLQQVGKIGEDLLKFVALPFAFLGMTADQLKGKYKSFIEESINMVPVEKRVSPKPAIASPLLEQVKYLFDDADSQNLVKMFSGLLSNAINSDARDKVHVSYVHTLQQLGSVEAKILSELYAIEDDRVFGCTFRRRVHVKQNYIQVLSDEPEYLDYEHENVFFYYDLLIIDDNLGVSNGVFYEAINILEHHNLISSLKINKYKNEEKYTLEKHGKQNVDELDPEGAFEAYRLTQYGRDFMFACIDPIVNMQSCFYCDICKSVFRNVNRDGVCTTCGNEDTKLL